MRKLERSIDTDKPLEFSALVCQSRNSHPCFSSYPNWTTSQLSSIDSYVQSSLTFAEQYSVKLTYVIVLEKIETNVASWFLQSSHVYSNSPLTRVPDISFSDDKRAIWKNAVKPWSCMQDILHYFFWLCTHLKYRLSPFFESVCKTDCDARTYTEFALMEVNRKISHPSL